MNTFLLVWSWGEETSGRRGSRDLSKITIMIKRKRVFRSNSETKSKEMNYLVNEPACCFYFKSFVLN